MKNKQWVFCLLISLLLATKSLSAEENHAHVEGEQNHSDAISEASHGDESEHAEEHDHEEKQGHDNESSHEDENSINLNERQRKSAGIFVEALSMQSVPVEIEAPGEILLNAYKSSQVSPRIEAQILERHVRLGDTVSIGQPLVTLSSISMAEAQAALLLAAKEWQRVKRLGKKVVSEKRYLESKVAVQQNRAKILAYGMTITQADNLVKGNDISKADGSFELLSSQNGTVIHDDFIVGQMTEPGQLLFQITDESTLWVEAHINPEAIGQITIGASARVQVNGNWVQGTLTQMHHELDVKTRTLSVRIEIQNTDDQLHPGQFVTTKINNKKASTDALVIPLSAVLRSADGDWQVFVEEEPDEFAPVEVEIVRQVQGKAVIDGLIPGTRVVTKGAFFLQSELAKSGFEVHNH